MKNIFERRKPLEIEVLFEAISVSNLSNSKSSFMNMLTSHDSYPDPQDPGVGI
jgi:hypothetical protein